MVEINVPFKMLFLIRFLVNKLSRFKKKVFFSNEKFARNFVFLFPEIYVFAFPIFPLSILKALERVYVKRWC